MSLGWCSASTILPKKKRDIHGVSGSTMIGLRAEMFTAQKRTKGTDKKRVATDGVSGGKSIEEMLKNKGVDSRARKDFEEDEREKDWKAHLEAKAALYTKYHTAGTTSLSEKQRDNLMVDFEGKMWDDDFDDDKKPGLQSDDMRRDNMRRMWEKSILDEAMEEAARDRRRQNLEEISDETKKARKRVLELREKRKKKEMRKLEMLRERRALRNLQGEADIAARAREVIEEQGKDEELHPEKYESRSEDDVSSEDAEWEAGVQAAIDRVLEQAVKPDGKGDRTSTDQPPTHEDAPTGLGMDLDEDVRFRSSSPPPSRVS